MPDPGWPHGGEIGVGIIGMGFMGRTHLAAYRAAAADGFNCRVHMVCDGDPDRWKGSDGAAGNIAGAARATIADARVVVDAQDVFDDPAVHLVSICTYTETHVDLAVRALQAGKHVLVEKPVSLEADRAEELRRVAIASGRLCMPAMCMRFWPGWDWLRDRIADCRFGSLHSLTLTRTGSRPAWADSFYRDQSRSGGALTDLHIHDVDFILWCFGMPHRVSAAGSINHLTTSYHFMTGSAPLHVAAEGGWSLAPAAGFRMRYVAAFEHATADFDLSREPRLVLHESDCSSPVPLANMTGYDGEIRHLLGAVAAGSQQLRATLDDAVMVLHLLNAERASLERGQTVEV